MGHGAVPRAPCRVCRYGRHGKKDERCDADSDEKKHDQLLDDLALIKRGMYKSA